MNALDPMILLAIFQEMLGPVLWLLLAVVVLGLLAFVALLVRERGVASRRLVLSQVLGILGLIGSAILIYTAAGWWSVRRRPA